MVMFDTRPQTARPPHMRFFRRPIEDRSASKELGHYAWTDVDYVELTPAGGNLVVEREVEPWLNNIRHEPFYDHCRRAYEAWKEGQEIPANGTALRLWPPISPAQLEQCTAIKILTVEDLAAFPDGKLTMLGMGGRALRQKAIEWLKAAADHGKLAEESTALKADLEERDRQIDELKSTIVELTARLKAADPSFAEAMNQPKGRQRR